MTIKIISHPSGDQLPIILDSFGMPIPLLNEFLLSRRHLSKNTLQRNAREIQTLWQWFEITNTDFVKKLKNAESFSEAQICGGAIPALRKSKTRSGNLFGVGISALTFNQKLTTSRQFIEWCFDVEIASVHGVDDRYERLLHQKKTISKWFTSALNSSPPNNKSSDKGLKDTEATFLLEKLRPSKYGDEINSAIKYRNYISTKLMLCFGLRPGELLSLKIEDVEFGAISAIHVRRRTQDPTDIRSPRPQIKRNGRTLIIQDMDFVREIDQYILIWREKLCERAKGDTEYLVVNDEGSPLGQTSLNQLYQSLRTKHKQSLPRNLSPKSLRHTFSFRMERTLRTAGIEEERRRKILAYLRGDTCLSSQDVYIEQEIEEQAKNALKSYHAKFAEGGTQ